MINATAKLKTILVLIARNPSIRTVEIADRVDCDTDQVQPMLQPHIDAGQILVIPVTAPNGRQANGFMFTEEARKGEEFRSLFEEGARAPAVAAPVASAPAPAAPSTPGISKIEVAIRYIRANGSASPQQLRELLKLEARQSPMAYLGGALKDGRLKLAGGQYLLGDGVPTAAPARKPARAPAKPKVKLPAAVPAAPALAIPLFKDAALAAVYGESPAPASAFRCGIWSDGEIELQRGGVTIARLSAAEIAVITAQLAQKAGAEVRQ